MSGSRTDDFRFEPLARSDLPMLGAWLHRPHVAEWWGSPSTLAELEHDYFPDAGTGSSTTKAYIASLEGVPIGFIQSYVALGSGDGWWEGETDPGTRGVDQFLADADRLGRGLGSAMVRAFVDMLFADPAVTQVQTDPSPDNERAIRSYRRAGFVVDGEVTTPDGPALLMIRHRTTCLVPMTAEAFPAFQRDTIAGYARQNVESGRWPPESALALSRDEHARLLPDGIATKDAHLFEIVDAASGAAVGTLWLAVQRPGGRPVGYVVNIEIAEAHRRKGHAKRALVAVEDVCRELGLSVVGLHVFAFNTPARRLYDALGYQATGITLRKSLASSGER